MATHAPAHTHEDDHVNHPLHHADSLKTYLIVFAALMVLLVVTVWVAFHHFGVFNHIIALAIAMTKTVLVILFFMHVRHASHLTWVFAGAGFFFLAIMLFFVFTDVLSRDWMDLTETETLPGPFEILMETESPATGSPLPAADTPE